MAGRLLLGEALQASRGGSGLTWATEGWRGPLQRGPVRLGPYPVERPPHNGPLDGSVSKVEMATPMALIYKVLFPSISTFETPPVSDTRVILILP